MSSPPLSGLRLIALDYGEARIGVAGSDELGLLAHPLETVAAHPREQALLRIARIFAGRKATALVLGLPVRADGEEGTAAAKVRSFAESLRSHLPEHTPIYFQDEYRSTVQASENLRASGKRTKSHRPLIDQAAAVVILQDFLDSHPANMPEKGLGETA
jgi:putative Holliday junction resolvase